MKHSLRGSRLNTRPETRARRRGFTLIELMVVILILAVLAALVVPKVVGRTGQAKTSAASSDLSSLSSMLNQFRIDCDRFPTTEEGLSALRVPPADLQGKWRGPYSQKEIPSDPWGNPYEYAYPGLTGPDSFVLRSLGSDGQEGGEGEAADIESE